MDAAMTATGSSSFPPLTADQAAMVEANLGLIGWILGRRRTPPDEWDDSFQDAVIGLARATQLFDPKRGFTFATYARPWIIQAIQRGRGTTMGANFRRAQGNNGMATRTEWVPPTSLDTTLHGYDNDGGALADLVLVDREPGPDTRGTNLGHLAELARILDSWNLDTIDRAIADELLTPCDDPHHINARVAQAHGTTREIIRRRRHALQNRLHAWARAGAA